MTIGINKLTTMNLESLLLSKITYELPLFQRDYSWTKTEWMELLEDAENCFNTNYQHFFGFMTFKVDDEKSISIIEGQQRLTTITIITGLIRDFLLQLNKNIAKNIESNFIKSNDPYSAEDIMFYRIRLSDHNQTFFQNYIQEGDSPENKIKNLKNEKNINQSKVLISQCYKFYYEYFDEKIKKFDIEAKIDFLSNFIKKLQQNFIVVYTEVRDEIAAYNIFQTLNNRGLDLNLTDLIKVFLFRNSGKKIDEVKIKWEEIRVNLEQTNANEFFRHYWLSKYNIVRSEDLLKVIEAKMKNEYQITSFLNEIGPEAESYNSLLFPTKLNWENEIIIEGLETIHILSKQLTLPLLLACKKIFIKDKDFLEAINLLTNFTFRYITIGNREHKTFERVLSKIAIELRDGIIQHVHQIKPELMKYDVENENFRLNFIENDFRRAPLAKYVLTKIEDYLSNNKNEKVSSSITLEHILPKNPDTKWIAHMKEFKMDYEDYVHKIGNLTLLNRRPNGQLQNKFITEKSEIFENCSDLKINDDLSKMKSWNSKDIYARSEKFAKIAVEIWSL